MPNFISKTFGRLCCCCCPRKSDDAVDNKSLIDEEVTETDGAVGGVVDDLSPRRAESNEFLKIIFIKINVFFVIF